MSKETGCGRRRRPVAFPLLAAGSAGHDAEAPAPAPIASACRQPARRPSDAPVVRSAQPSPGPFIDHRRSAHQLSFPLLSLIPMPTVILPPTHPVASLSPPAASPFDRLTMTASQQASLDNLIAHFSDPSLTVAVPSSSAVPELCKPIAYTERLTEGEQFWLSEECFLRFLRATKWDEAQARDRLAKTLAWRREFGVESFTREYLSCVLVFWALLLSVGGAGSTSWLA